MTYNVYYVPKGLEWKKDTRGYCLFDIEYYLNKSDEERWNSEIHCLPIVDGIAHFVKDIFSEDGEKVFDFDDFLNDAKDIQEIRGLLYERYNNKPKSYTDARQFHYHVFGKVLREKLDDLCKKYKLFLNID